MKWVRDRNGGDRLWLEDGEIEKTTEDELRRAGIYPSVQEPVVAVEHLLEGHLNVRLNQYADLPEEVLGLTEFIPGEPPRVLINRRLTEAADADGQDLGLVGRWRATMAHEASHVIFHRVLFEFVENQEELFAALSGKKNDRLFRCLKREVAFGGGTDWREYQANRGMAGLLMPRASFREIVGEVMNEHGFVGEIEADGPRCGILVNVVAERCSVSRQAARIRLSTLGLTADPDQATLALP